MKLDPGITDFEKMNFITNLNVRTKTRKLSKENIDEGRQELLQCDTKITVTGVRLLKK